MLLQCFKLAVVKSILTQGVSFIVATQVRHSGIQQFILRH